MLRDIKIGAFRVFEDIRDIEAILLRKVMSNLLFNKMSVINSFLYRSGDVFGAQPRISL